MTVEYSSSIHPLLPPTTEDQRFDWLRLLRSRRVGISTFYRLMQEFGSAAAALDHLPQIALAAGVASYEACSKARIEAEFIAARTCGAQLLCRGDAAYPPMLCDLEDAPPLLWVMGDVSLLSKPQIALVGARNASSLGGRMARSMARDLGAAGFIITSGLARGIDTAAHLAALDTGTIAVLGGGVDVLYPAENARLAQDILDQGGARISEQPIGLAPQARHFPMRNRLISGLARAVIVVEAAARSGSLITARNALDQGRDVMAVPGHPFDARASGCNMLLRDGARLVRHADDVIEAIGPLVAPAEDTPANTPTGPTAETPTPSRTLAEVAQLHQRILDRLGPSPMGEDQLIRDLGANSKTVSPALTDLELQGSITRQPGGLISRII